ncbi:MAG: glycosyltransferase family 4 protein [Tepidisphaeraceae bacterium]
MEGTNRTESEGSGASIVISAGSLDAGGVKTHLMLLSKMLSRTGARVTIVGTKRGWTEREIEEVAATGVRVKVPPRWMARDAGHSRLSRAYAAAALPLWAWRAPTCLYLIGVGNYHLWACGWFGRAAPTVYHEVVCNPEPDNLCGRCALASDGVVANSLIVADQFRPFVGRIPVKVIPFLTMDKPCPPPSPRPAAGDRELRVVYLGRVIEHKRPDVLVQQWKSLTATGPIGPARLDIYGYDASGSLIPKLRRFASENGIEHIVTLHGSYQNEQLDDILGAADVVVLPSLLEGLPLVLVEAMQRGVPVVSTDAGGSAELGRENPDVRITAMDWDAFVNGLREMAGLLRVGKIDAVRLHHWTETRYGYATVARQWRAALLRPREFFGPGNGSKQM